jgi:hypothetical protein
MIGKPFTEASYPVITINEDGAMLYESAQLLHTCFRGFVDSFKDRKVVDSNGTLWTIKSVVEVECLTPFILRFFRASVVRVRFEMEDADVPPFRELLQEMLTIIKKAGWALITAGRVNEYTARDSRLISADLIQANSIPEIVTVLMKPLRKSRSGDAKP